MKSFGNKKEQSAFWEQLPEKVRHEIAYHEAGHAAMYFFFGESIECVSMRGNQENAAFVRKFKPQQERHVIHLKSTELHALAKVTAMQESMIFLAGPCAVHIFNGGESEWLEELFEENWDDEFTDNSDLSRTVRMARALHETSGRQDQFIKRMAQWTEEALTMPHLWELVKVLAEKLNTQKSMTGNMAFRIMRKAWGIDHHCLITTIRNGNADWFPKCRKRSTRANEIGKATRLYTARGVEDAIWL